MCVCVYMLCMPSSVPVFTYCSQSYWVSPLNREGQRSLMLLSLALVWFSLLLSFPLLLLLCILIFPASLPEQFAIEFADERIGDLYCIIWGSITS